MRITGGKARGRVVRQKVQKGVRPTSSKVREALFSMIGHDLSGERVLDAFGGSGIMGLEAWSRGADVTIVEKRPQAARVLKEAGQSVAAAWNVVVGDSLKVAPRLGPFDGIFADPPYALDPGPILELLAPLAEQWLVFETDVDRQLPGAVGHLELYKRRDFGQTSLWVYFAQEGDEE